MSQLHDKVADVAEAVDRWRIFGKRLQKREDNLFSEGQAGAATAVGEERRNVETHLAVAEAVWYLLNVEVRRGS